MRGHLNYTEIRQRFERQSTFHGICHASLAPNKKWRYFWYAAFLICLIFLLVQIFFLILKYRQYAKTVDLDVGSLSNRSSVARQPKFVHRSYFQLKFENAPFPSITVCNLNPYKKSAVMQNPETKKTVGELTISLQYFYLKKSHKNVRKKESFFRRSSFRKIDKGRRVLNKFQPSREEKRWFRRDSNPGREHVPMWRWCSG